jgi:hypothetical protein
MELRTGPNDISRLAPGVYVANDGVGSTPVSVKVLKLGSR